MSNGRVYPTKYGWVAADDAGWIPQIFKTEAEAWAAAGPGATMIEPEPEITKGWVDENIGVVHINVCTICFCVVHDGLMESHLHWHKIAAGSGHRMHVEAVLRGGDDG